MKKSLVAVAALALGGMLTAAPALAQKAANDGGQPHELAAGTKLDGGPAVQPTRAYIGKGLNDGGIPPEPSAQDAKASTAQNKVATQRPSAPGKNPNDGGPIQ